MPRLLSPDDKCVQVDDVRTGRRYTGTTVNVTDPSAIRALKEVGYTVAGISATPVRSGGYACVSCGFHGFFKVCGRCGGDCEKE